MFAKKKIILVVKYILAAFLLLFSIILMIRYNAIISGILFVIFSTFLISTWFIKEKIKKQLSGFKRLIILIILGIAFLLRLQPTTIRDISIDILKPLNGKHAFQPFFAQLYLAGVKGMNYYIGNISNNGELAVIKYVRSKLKEENHNKITIFDVGASVGNYTDYLLQEFDDELITIHAFEPSKTAFAELQHNMAGRPNVLLYNIGLGKQLDTVKLYYYRPGSARSSIYADAGANIQTQYEEIIITSIDDFCREKQIDKIAFLKLDVEGYEYPIFEGAMQMIKAKKIRFIQFEFGHNMPSKTYFKDFYKLLHEQYNLYRVVKDGLVPIGKYRQDLHEIMISVNFFAELK